MDKPTAKATVLGVKASAGMARAMPMANNMAQAMSMFKSDQGKADAVDTARASIL